MRNKEFSIFSVRGKYRVIPKYSLTAGLFTGVWALYHRMWNIGIPVTGLMVIHLIYGSYIATGSELDTTNAALFLIINVFVGFIIPIWLFFRGNKYLIKHMKDSDSEHIVYIGSFQASNKEDAIQKAQES